MSLRMAFVGFRHGHIMGLYARAQESDEIEIVGACEEDGATRDSLASAGTVKVTHTDIDAMLDEVECDVVAICDYYAKRGAIAVKALERGRHVIADKPLCTRLEERDRIEELAAAGGLKVGCMLDLRDIGQYIGARELILGGEIGEVHAVSFGGQHPLSLGRRPAWYFEPGKHGGTINDIGVHAFDYIPWATGLRFSVVNAARCWNAFAADYPHFSGAAQMMLTMDNGCGVLGDVSYFAPDNIEYTFPFAWRMTFWGRKGVIELSCSAQKITLAAAGATELKLVDPPPGNPGGYLASYLADLAGSPTENGLTTDSVLEAARVALTVQQAGDEGLRELSL